MTFDEAIEMIEELQGSAGYATGGVLEANNFSGYDVHEYLNTATEIINELREEYAPTVEMPAEGKKYFDSAKKYPDEQLFDSFAIFDSNSKREMQTMLGTDDIRGLTNGYQTMAGSFAKNSESTDEIMKKYTVPFMQAWLHPETIKVVDE